MKFINVPGNPVQAPMDCRRAHPPLEHIEFGGWKGELPFKVTAQTRAGFVEVADFELRGDPPRARVVDALREAVLAALSAYECQGDHVFEHEFPFEAK